MMDAHFVNAKVITSKKDQKEYGIVSVVAKGPEGGQAQDLFCDPDIAKDARQRFAFLQPVKLLVSQAMGYRGLELRLTGLEPVK